MPLPMIEQLAALVQPWADMYADSKLLSAGTTVLHIGGLLAGGGLAIATDRQVLRLPANDGAGQRVVLESIRTVHKLVLGSLVVLVLSGAMFLAADLKTFLGSPVYWAKMSAVALLLLNGLRLRRAELRLHKSAASLPLGETMPIGEWKALSGAAMTSVVLWFTIMTLGVVLESA